MKIQFLDKNQYNIQNTSFKAGVLNIIAQADQHGHILTMPCIERTIKSDFQQMFSKPDQKSTLNIFAIVGDFFMNPMKKGFITHPQLSNGDFQAKYLKELINIIKSLFKQKNFQTVFAPGNHDFDGGDCWLMSKLSKLPMISIMTNVNPLRSPLVKEYREKSKNIVESKIFTIPDDKDKSLKHKVLFLGVTIPAMKFYTPGLLKGTEFYGDNYKKDSKINAEDMIPTINAIKHVVEKFKKTNPNGTVILMSHCGNRISEYIRKEIPNINIILNGHDHANTTTINLAKDCIENSDQYKTQAIVSLGADNEFLKSVTLQFNDNGKLDNHIIIKTYNTYPDNISERDNSILLKKIKKDFKDDIVPLAENVNSNGQGNGFEYNKNIYWCNSELLNYLTTELCEYIKNNFNGKFSDIDSITLQTSGIRGGIKEGASNIDLMQVFDGINEDLSELYIGHLSGKDLIGMIVENVKENIGINKRERNTILYWSDIQINRSLINDILNNKSTCSFNDAIKMRGDNGEFNESIDINRQYRIVVPNKYIIKTDIQHPQKIRKDFSPLGATPNNIFRTILAQKNYSYLSNNRVKETRIINTTTDI